MMPSNLRADATITLPGEREISPLVCDACIFFSHDLDLTLLACLFCVLSGWVWVRVRVFLSALSLARSQMLRRDAGYLGPVHLPEFVRGAGVPLPQAHAARPGQSLGRVLFVARGFLLFTYQKGL